METAIDALKSDPPRFTDDRREYALPDYSPDLRRAAFRNRNVELAYFDGKEWRHWKCSDIDPNAGPGSTIGPPFFDKTGHLCVCLEDASWQLDDQGHWQQKDVEVKFPYNFPSIPTNRRRVTPPDGSVTNSPESIVADNQGADWLTW